MWLPNYQSLSLGEIKSRISRLTEIGKPEQNFLFSNITDWQLSEKRKFMLTAQDYYNNDADIKDRKREYIDRKGNKQEATNLSNSKLRHPFMRRLTNQKVNYLLSKEPSFSSDNDAFIEALATYLDKKFFKKLKNVGKDAIINGIAWLQVYYDTEGKLCFKRINSEEIIPFWADADHTILDAVLRVYPMTQLLPNGYKKEVYKVEYHTSNGVWYYELGDKGLKADPEKGDEPRGHFVVEQPAVDKDNNPIVDKQGIPVTEEAQATWDRVPFIAFKYNSDEMSLLKSIKSLVDDYDINTSDTSNTLQDVPNSIKVVRNYDGTDKGEFVQNLNTFRTAFVSGDGDMTSLNTPLDMTAVDSHLNRLKRDIFEAGCGVDTQDDNLGNASGVALKFRYAGLDMDVCDMGSEFSAALEDLIWFIKVDMIAKGLGDFMDVDFEVVFNTDSIINESEVINAAKASVGLISDDTIIANHPWVTDPAAEQERLKTQREEAIKEAQNNMMFEANLNYGEGAPEEGNNDEDTNGGEE